MGEETFVSRHCDLTVPVTYYHAPAHVLPQGHIAAATLSLCSLRFIICAESVLVYFLVAAMPHGKFGRLGRPATDCQRPGWETRVTPRLHHCLLTSPVTVCRTAVSWHFLYVDSATPWPDTRDATPPGCSWYRPLSTPYCLYPAGADH